MQDLNILINDPSWVLEEARDINDKGQIVGNGKYNGKMRGFVLTPTDSDGDGVLDVDDNCPQDANPDQENYDNDGLGDECDTDDDNDIVADSIDNCPLHYNTDQSDWDSDSIGDACDEDRDGDNINDGIDQCINTVLGDVINSDGCSIADLCSCANEWKNHGSYIKCIAHSAEDFVATGLITDIEKDVIVSEAAQSSCGANRFKPASSR